MSDRADILLAIAQQHIANVLDKLTVAIAKQERDIEELKVLNIQLKTKIQQLNTTEQ